MEKEKENGQRLERQVRLQMRLFKSFKLQTQMLYVLSYGITFGATGTAYFTGIMLDLILDINLFSLVMCGVVDVVQLVAVVFALRSVQLSEKTLDQVAGYTAFILSVLGFFVSSAMLLFYVGTR